MTLNSGLTISCNFFPFQFFHMASSTSQVANQSEQSQLTSHGQLTDGVQGVWLGPLVVSWCSKQAV